MLNADFYCPKVPTHLAHRISQVNWDWINDITYVLYEYQVTNNPHASRDYSEIKPWMIRGYWLITLFLNPSQDNFKFVREQLYQHKFFTEQDNLRYLEFVEDIKGRIHEC